MSGFAKEPLTDDNIQEAANWWLAENKLLYYFYMII